MPQNISKNVMRRGRQAASWSHIRVSEPRRPGLVSGGRPGHVCSASQWLRSLFSTVTCKPALIPHGSLWISGSRTQSELVEAVLTAVWLGGQRAKGKERWAQAKPWAAWALDTELLLLWSTLLPPWADLVPGRGHPSWPLRAGHRN